MDGGGSDQESQALPATCGPAPGHVLNSGTLVGSDNNIGSFDNCVHFLAGFQSQRAN